MKRTHSFDLCGTPVSFESGRLAPQADGAVMMSYGDISLLATVQMGGAREGIDFFPLVVDYQPKFYASGKIKGSRFIKREGRPGDNGILVCRLIDRPLRPMFPKGMSNEVQVIVNLLQTDEVFSSSASAITAASMAIQLSGIPFEAPVSAVRVGMKEDGELYLNPTFEEIENGRLDLLVAGTEDAITMVEAGANLVSNEDMIRALDMAHKEIQKMCQEQRNFVKQFDIQEKEITQLLPPEAEDKAVDACVSDADFSTVSGITKKEFKEKIHVLEDKVLNAYETQIAAEELSAKSLKQVFHKKFSKYARQRVFDEGKRIDGRAVDEVRPLAVEVGILPRLHGSGIFQRGETQVLSVLALGGPRDKQLIDDPDRKEYESRYFHHYNFPPFSVGEVRMLRGVGRREIGHGALAERALKYVLPSETGDDGFPYTMHVVSEVLSCNGSSSMASICGSTLALMDAGVPIRTPIAGIAMGLMMNEETGDYRILTDIQGFEDADGDMDFKVAGDENGITALQLDIKIKGLQLSLLEEALKRAQEARQHILASMKSVIDQPREKLSDFAPRILSTKIKEEQIAMVIGKGGETIQGLCATYSSQIEVKDDGQIFITGEDAEAAEGALEAIKKICYEPKIGDVFTGTVKKICDFGAFVEYLPKKEALVHVSEIANERVNRVEDYLKDGQKVRVKFLGQDKERRVKLSMKDIDQSVT